jgi:RNA polymerase sigma-70 factor (ECF subfamily)
MASVPPSALALRDPTTFAAAFRRHAPAALAAADAVLHDRYAAEDIVQEVFATLWARPETFAPDRGSLGTFVRVMSRSRALDRLRANSAAAAAAARLGAVPAPAETTVEAVERGEVLRAIARAFESLPPLQRTAVLLHHVRGFSDREIAGATGVPLGTAKSRIRLGTGRARRAGLAAAVA